MEMDPHDTSDVEDESPISHNDEEISESEDLARENEDPNSPDEAARRHERNLLLEEHNDVLSKLKMQVREMKAHEDFNNRHLSFSMPNRTPGLPENFAMMPFPFTHPAAHAFLPPVAPPPVASHSGGSSNSSAGSPSPQNQQTWSFEEQFKQVRQLYEINDDPKRKEFLDDLFSFMQKKGSPINRLPIMAKSVLDLYELYNLVIARGGLVEVINKKLWQEIIKGLHLPSSITSAAFTLRTQYMKFLYPYECEKRRLSTPQELQAAIDGNRREGRRGSYAQFDSIQRSPIPSTQMSPLSLVSQHQQMTARMNSAIMSGGMGLHNGAHHPSHPPPIVPTFNGGPMPAIAPSELNAHVLEYFKMYKDNIRNAATSPRQGDSSPPTDTSPINQLATIWNLCNSGPIQHHEPQKEALNLSETSQHSQSNNNNNISSHNQNQPIPKREIERECSPPPKKFHKDNGNNGESNHVINSIVNIKVNSRGDPRDGDNSLVVTLELNGLQYQGVLFAQSTCNSSDRTALTSS